MSWIDISVPRSQRERTRTILEDWWPPDFPDEPVWEFPDTDPGRLVPLLVRERCTFSFLCEDEERETFCGAYNPAGLDIITHANSSGVPLFGVADLEGSGLLKAAIFGILFPKYRREESHPRFFAPEISELPHLPHPDPESLELRTLCDALNQADSARVVGEGRIRFAGAAFLRQLVDAVLPHRVGWVQPGALNNLIGDLYQREWRWAFSKEIAGEVPDPPKNQKELELFSPALAQREKSGENILGRLQGLWPTDSNYGAVDQERAYVLEMAHQLGITPFEIRGGASTLLTAQRVASTTVRYVRESCALDQALPPEDTPAEESELKVDAELDELWERLEQAKEALESFDERRDDLLARLREMDNEFACFCGETIRHLEAAVAEGSIATHRLDHVRGNIQARIQELEDEIAERVEASLGDD